MAEYSVKQDSSKGFHEDGTLVLVVDEGTCGCGCMQNLLRPKSTFLQGHDATYKGKLQRAFRNGIAEVAIVSDGMRVTSDPMSLAQDRGWGDKMAGKPARSKKASKGEGTPIEVKVGRWTYPGLLFEDGSKTYTKKDQTVVTIPAS